MIPVEKLRQRLKEEGYALVRSSKHEIWRNPHTGKQFTLPRRLSDNTRQFVNYMKQLDRLADKKVILQKAVKNEEPPISPPPVKALAMEWYAWICDIRETARLSVRDVEDLAKLTRGSLGRIERGVRRFSAEELERWRRVFDNIEPPMHVPLATQGELNKRKAKARKYVLCEKSQENEEMMLPVPTVDCDRDELVEEVTKIIKSARLTDEEVDALVRMVKDQAIKFFLGE